MGGTHGLIGLWWNSITRKRIYTLAALSDNYLRAYIYARRIQREHQPGSCNYFFGGAISRKFMVIIFRAGTDPLNCYPDNL